MINEVTAPLPLPTRAMELNTILMSFHNMLRARALQSAIILNYTFAVIRVIAALSFPAWYEHYGFLLEWLVYTIIYICGYRVTFIDLLAILASFGSGHRLAIQLMWACVGMTVLRLLVLSFQLLYPEDFSESPMDTIVKNRIRDRLHGLHPMPALNEFIESYSPDNVNSVSPDVREQLSLNAFAELRAVVRLMDKTTYAAKLLRLLSLADESLEISQQVLAALNGHHALLFAKNQNCARIDEYITKKYNMHYTIWKSKVDAGLICDTAHMMSFRDETDVKEIAKWAEETIEKYSI